MSSEEENHQLLVTLATDLSELGATVVLMGTGVERLAEQVEQHDSLMGTMTEAVRASTAMLEKMAHADADTGDKDGKVKRKIGWLDDLKPEEVSPEFSKLRTWVETKLLPTWPAECRAVLPPCWPQHPAVMVELQALSAYWLEAYDPKTGGVPAKAAEWLDRWRPNAFARIGLDTKACEPWEHKAPPVPQRSRETAWEAAKADRRSNRTAPAEPERTAAQREPVYAGAPARDEPVPFTGASSGHAPYTGAPNGSGVY